MARTNYKDVFKKILVDFIGEEDPILAMLEWTAQRMMEIESEAKVGAKKGEHSRERKTYFSGTRVRRMDTRLGTVYLFIPKLRNGVRDILAIEPMFDESEET